MSQSVGDLLKGKNYFFVGASATAFRLFCLRLSRLAGTFSVEVEASLKKRPHSELFALLEQLGVFNIAWEKNILKFQSRGWPLCDLNLKVDTSYSSQYLSAICLNVWGFPYSVSLNTNEEIVSNAYWMMSKEILLSNELIVSDNFVIENIPNKPKKVQVDAEPDMSSLASILAYACLDGQVKLRAMNAKMLQPDIVFFEIVKKMGVQVIENSESLFWSSPDRLLPIKSNLSSCPDLFPVLAVLASFAEGVSIFEGVSHLRFKESNRLEKIAELLDLVGVRYSMHADAFKVFGSADLNFNFPLKDFNPSNDHRLVMAACLLKWKGASLNILDSESINKSFPEYFNFAPITKKVRS
jgi:3-phosphoshikimate 1-carboxyvinyltransferase